MNTQADGYVLLVEDDAETSAAYRSILESEGYRVVCVHGGFQALSRLRTEPGTPRLVILDVNMPGVDGLEFRRMKAKAPQFADVPVIVVSARAGDIDFAAADDVKAVLSKPVDILRMMTEVATWVRAA